MKANRSMQPPAKKPWLANGRHKHAARLQAAFTPSPCARLTASSSKTGCSPSCASRLQNVTQVLRATEHQSILAMLDKPGIARIAQTTQKSKSHPSGRCSGSAAKDRAHTGRPAPNMSTTSTTQLGRVPQCTQDVAFMGKSMPEEELCKPVERAAPAYTL